MQGRRSTKLPHVVKREHNCRNATYVVGAGLVRRGVFLLLVPIDAVVLDLDARGVSARRKSSSC